MIFRALNWIRYWLYGKTIYRLHSPFVFAFARDILRDDRTFYAFSRIEQRRKQLLADTTLIDLEDHGAGSSRSPGQIRTVREITRHASVPPKYGRMLFRTVQQFKPRTVLELGSCTGIGSMYLAAAMDGGRFITLEGDPSLAEIARESLKRCCGRTDAEVVTGAFSDTLQETLGRLEFVDMAYIDGNHRRDATIEYFEALLPKCHEGSILVFDDIYWSAEMGEAWKAIKAHPKTRLTIDLYRMGLVFFREENREPEHFQLYF